MPKLEGLMQEVLRDQLRKRPELADKVRRNAARRHLAQALTDARRKARMTQKRLAAVTGMDQAQISRMESVTAPRPDDRSVQRFLQGCGYVPGYVWGRPGAGGLQIEGAVALSDSEEDERLIEGIIDVEVPLAENGNT